MWSLVRIELFKVFRKPRTYIAFAAVLLVIGLIHVAIGASSIHYLARPHLFTLLFLAAAVWLLDRDRLRPTPALWALIPLLIAVFIRGGIVPVHCWMTDLFEHATFGTALMFVTPIAGAYARFILLGFFTLSTFVYAAKHGVHGVGMGDFAVSKAGLFGLAGLIMFGYVGFVPGNLQEGFSTAPGVAAGIDRDNAFPPALWAKLGAMGLLGITVEEQHGRSGRNGSRQE